MDFDKLVDSNSVYLVAVEAMYKFAQVAWQRKVSTQIRVTQAYSDATIQVTNAGTLYQLENSHLILGLYRGVLSMLARNEWYETVIILKVHGIIVGYISIAGPQRGTALNGTTAIPPEEVATARSLEGPFPRRGRFSDPEDRTLQLAWTHQTEPISRMVQDAIYTAVLRGLANAAFYDPATLVNEVNAESVHRGPDPLDYSCNFQISVDLDDGYPGPLTYYLVTKTFRDVAAYIMPQEQWYGEYEIDLYYRQKLNAYVEVTKRDHD